MAAGLPASSENLNPLRQFQSSSFASLIKQVNLCLKKWKCFHVRLLLKVQAQLQGKEMGNSTGKGVLEARGL